MELIDLRHKKIMQALKSLDTAVQNFNNFKSQQQLQIPSFTNRDEMYLTYRDSMIQRFEYCTELFWKYLKKYLEAYVQQPLINGPAPVIRASFSAGLLNEQEAESALEMIKDRNMTSHIYKEEIAELLATKIPQHYRLMNMVAARLIEKKINNDSLSPSRMR